MFRFADARVYLRVQAWLAIKEAGMLNGIIVSRTPLTGGPSAFLHEQQLTSVIRSCVYVFLMMIHRSEICYSV